MPLPKHIVPAIYQDPGVESYRGNPFIEALPKIYSLKDIKQLLQGNVTCNPTDIFANDRQRPHEIASLLDDFFQPIGNHMQLEEKLSIMIRRGYVGRNLVDGSMNTHLQNGYERLMTGELSSYRFDTGKSTAKSISLIGVSGCGKSTTLGRLLSAYPQAIYHEKYHKIQLPYLKIECPFNGSLVSLCHNFFRELGRILDTNLGKKYSQGRYGAPALLAIMAQKANENAIGVLVIDEIQRLTRKRDAGREEMMEFFVELVNIIGIPVVLVGTPKARPIFEIELQAGRRTVGLGSLVWEPMKNLPTRVNPKTGDTKPSEWIAFTNKLWKYQWLKKREETLSDELRNCWYDLTQGVQDLAVKLFVFAQLRAIATKQEKLSINLFKKVYQDEFKAVHKMLAALRSNDPEKIAQYSDLRIEDVDKRLLKLNQQIAESRASEEALKERFDGNEQALRLFHLLEGLECTPELAAPLVEKAFKEFPGLSMQELMPIVLSWYNEKPEQTETADKPRSNVIKPKQWLELDKNSMRYQFALNDGKNMYQALKSNNRIFDMERWIQKAPK